MIKELDEPINPNFKDANKALHSIFDSINSHKLGPTDVAYIAANIFQAAVDNSDCETCVISLCNAMIKQATYAIEDSLESLTETRH